MRPIKFRGRDLDSGEYVFFNLEDILLDVAGSYSEYVGLHNIDPDSVAQLVGYDANGNEIYEGDTVIDERDGEWKAIIYSSLTLPFETDNGDLTVWGQGVTLKGGDQ